MPGIFINCGWATGGFKASSGLGCAIAQMLARGAPGALAVLFSRDRFRNGRRIDEIAAAVAH